MVISVLGEVHGSVDLSTGWRVVAWQVLVAALKLSLGY